MSAPATPPPGRKRKSRPYWVEVHACLYQLFKRGKRVAFNRMAIRSHLLDELGVDPTLPWDMQHDPPLGLRPFDHDQDDYDPPENDYRYMFPMQKEDHKKITSEVDRPAIDKTRRRAKKQRRHAEHRNLKTYLDEIVDAPKPKRKIPSRPFAKRKRPFTSRRSKPS